MTKLELIKEIIKIYKYTRRTLYTPAERVQQQVRTYWKLEDLVEKIQRKRNEN